MLAASGSSGAGRRRAPSRRASRWRRTSARARTAGGAAVAAARRCCTSTWASSPSTSTSRAGCADADPRCRSGQAAVERVLAVARVRPHLRRPPPLLHRLRPRLADQHVRALDLVEGAILWRVLDHDRLELPADAHGERLQLVARDRHHPRDGQQARHVLPVVDLVEEALLRGVDVHGGAEEIAGVDGHGVAPFRGVGGCSGRGFPAVGNCGWADALGGLPFTAPFRALGGLPFTARCPAPVAGLCLGGGAAGTAVVVLAADDVVLAEIGPVLDLDQDDRHAARVLDAVPGPARHVDGPPRLEPLRMARDDHARGTRDDDPVLGPEAVALQAEPLPGPDDEPLDLVAAALLDGLEAAPRWRAPGGCDGPRASRRCSRCAGPGWTRCAPPCPAGPRRPAPGCGPPGRTRRAGRAAAQSGAPRRRPSPR